MSGIKHILGVDILNVSCPSVLKIVDVSIYADGLLVECPRLDITIPGITQPVYITTPDIDSGFVKTISAIDLGLQSVTDTETVDLPDGLYNIKYSVSPNDKTIVEYNYLRCTKILISYYKELCKVDLAQCEPTSEQHRKLHDLRYIKMYIDAAKSKAEYCNSKRDAVNMLDYAKKLLDKYKTGKCIICK